MDPPSAQPVVEHKGGLPASSSPPRSVTSKTLAEKFPNAHRILSELHTMKKLNEELFNQLENSRHVLNTLADQLPGAADAIRGVGHILDPSMDATPIVPAAAAETTTRAGAMATADVDESSSVKRRFLQFVDETVEKAKSHVVHSSSSATPSSSAPAAASGYEQMYMCLRLKVTAHENAQKQLGLSRQRLEDCKDELAKVRKALRESAAESAQRKSDCDALRLSLEVYRHAADASSSSHGDKEDDDPIKKGHGVSAPSKEAKVDALFDAMFEEPRKRSDAASEATTKALNAQVHRLSDRVFELESLLEAQTRANAPLEQLLTAAQLEIEGLHMTTNTIRADASELRQALVVMEEARDVMSAAMTDLERKYRVSQQECSSIRKHLEDSHASAMKVQEAALRKDLRDAQTALGELNARYLQEQQRLEQANREVLALQRMLNSKDLDNDDTEATRLKNSGVPRPASTSPSSVAAPSELVCNTHAPTRAAADQASTDALGEALHRSRLALRALQHAKQRSDSQLVATTRQRDQLRRGMRSLGVRVMQTSILRSFAANYLHVQNTPATVLASDAQHAAGASSMHADDWADAPRQEDTTDNARRPSCCSADQGTQTSVDTPVVVVGQEPCDEAYHREQHFLELSSTVQFLQREKKILQRSVVELQEALRCCAATAGGESVHDDSSEDLGSRDSTRSSLNGSVACKDSTAASAPLQPPTAMNLVSVPSRQSSSASMSTDDTVGLRLTNAVTRERAVGHSLTDGARVVVPGGTWQAHPWQQPVPQPRQQPRQRGLRGFFGRMVGVSQGSTKTATGHQQQQQSHHDIEFVPKQQLHNIQRLLEAQIKENMALEERLAEERQHRRSGSSS